LSSGSRADGPAGRATSHRPARILLLSNGHGEDLSGALIGQELQRLGHTVHALPLVGHGRAYAQAGLPMLGRTREYSTGGLATPACWAASPRWCRGRCSTC
jgi:hypothetical protein